MTEEPPGVARAKDLWALAIVVVCMLVLVICGVLYTNHIAWESEHKWCDLLVTLDSPIPPNVDNPRAQVAAAKLHKLRQDFHC